VGCTSPISCTSASDSQCQSNTTTTTTGDTTTTGGGGTTSTTLPAGLAHFNCYRTRDLGHPRFVPQRNVSIVDQFDSSTIDVRKPYLLCAPASEDASTVADPSTHLCCYKTRAHGLGTPV
jgi:hypothetical protein